jgi:catechol 2,3-dioxygenase-like lactoylglutathione lyase family enzyme
LIEHNAFEPHSDAGSATRSQPPVHSHPFAGAGKLNTMKLTYHHVSRSTGRLLEMLKFYRAIGCTLEKHVIDGVQGLERAVLNLPGSNACLQLIQRQGGPITPAGLDWPDHIAFHTPDLEQALTELLAAGATLESGPYSTPTGSLVAFVQDPDGHRIELVEKR